jgi:hypothetical protein
VASDYLRERLRNAVLAITDGAGLMTNRLRSAYVYSLSTLQASDFPDEAGAVEFREIREALNKYGEAVEEGGSLETTLWTMTEEDADRLGQRVVALAKRYGEA